MSLGVAPWTTLRARERHRPARACRLISGHVRCCPVRHRDRPGPTGFNSPAGLTPVRSLTRGSLRPHFPTRPTPGPGLGSAPRPAPAVMRATRDLAGGRRDATRKSVVLRSTLSEENCPFRLAQPCASSVNLRRTQVERDRTAPAGVRRRGEPVSSAPPRGDRCITRRPPPGIVHCPVTDLRLPFQVAAPRMA
jgi:hypothetical protein